MQNSIKLIVVATFGIFGLGLFLNGVGAAGNSGFFGSADPTPTPPRNGNAATANKPMNANMAANSMSNAANSGPSKPVTPPAGNKTITKKFVLGKDSLSEYGEAPFDHETHAFGKYSPDGQSTVGCVECHHTDQPKSALKPPLFTSERDVVLTMEEYQRSNQKVSECRACHVQDGNVPEGKEMPKATYTEGAKTTTKDLNNELAYHINCNTCHDAAFKLRPDLKKKPGFATTKDCTICHVSN
jgi:hypothetical protein